MRRRIYGSNSKHYDRSKPSSGSEGGYGESDVLAKIAEMQEPDRAMAERLHAIIKAGARHLVAEDLGSLYSHPNEHRDPPRMEQSGFRPDMKQTYGGAKAGWFFAKVEQVQARTDHVRANGLHDPSLRVFKGGLR